jgi:hypothetical protein
MSAPRAQLDQVVGRRGVTGNGDGTNGGVEAIGERGNDGTMVHDRGRHGYVLVAQNKAAAMQFVGVDEGRQRHSTLVAIPTLPRRSPGAAQKYLSLFVTQSSEVSRCTQ